MQTRDEIDVTKIVDGRQLTGFNYRLIAMCFIVARVDGRDIRAGGSDAGVAQMTSCTKSRSEEPRWAKAGVNHVH